MEFKNVTVVKAANIYFDGKVTSRTVLMSDGERKTLGFMVEGTYKFATGTEELMEVLGGEMEVRLPGETAFKTYLAGTSFVVPAHTEFEVKVSKFADYCCSYK